MRLALLLVALVAHSTSAQRHQQQPQQQQQQAPPPPSQSRNNASWPCPANTFTCKDGSCIPMAWVGDGEPDCDDSSDEDGVPAVDIPSSSHITRDDKNEKDSEPMDEGDEGFEVEEEVVEEEPSSTTSSSASDDCPAGHAERYQECARPIEALVTELGNIDLQNVSLFEDTDVLDKLEASCELLREYDVCIEGAAMACKQSKTIQAWRDTEMYMCQLLVPSVKEHSACFQMKRDPQCKVTSQTSATPLCRIVSSVIDDMICLEKLNKCAADAREMLVPIQMESEHVAKDLKCTGVVIFDENKELDQSQNMTVAPSTPLDESSMTTEPFTEPTSSSPKSTISTTISTTVPTTVSSTVLSTTVTSTPKSTTTTTTVSTSKKMTTEPTEAPSTESTTTTTTTVTTTEVVETSTASTEDEDEDAPFNSSVFGEASLSSEATTAQKSTEGSEVEREMEAEEAATSASVPKETTPSTAEYDDIDAAELEESLRQEHLATQPTKVAPTAQTPSSAVSHTQTSTRPSTTAKLATPQGPISLSNGVLAMYSIEQVCADKSIKKEIYGALQNYLCKRFDDILEHKECFAATIQKAKCPVKEPKSECEALEAFNANIDCAIIVMNDECPIESQDLVVELQEQINDISIQKKCFQEEDEKENKDADQGEFPLSPSIPRCTDNQENAALACLVELVEINKQFALFQNQNFLLEIATENSTLIAGICDLFGKYETCLAASVFSESNGQRCSFASPLNTIARIGLQPLCDSNTRPLLVRHRDCLEKLSSNPAALCQSGILGLGGAIQQMMQGIHAEALLCKSFYVIRETFECGEQKVSEFCDASAVEDLRKVKTQMSSIGEEEGCPKDQPANLDEIIRRPVQRPTPFPIPLAPQRAVSVPLAPQARPLAPPMRVIAPVQSCNPEEQKKFQECVKSMTVFQPHPLSVIKMPRQIDEACEKFVEFKKCTADIECHPLWAKGMGAMFEFACGTGMPMYKDVRQCIRKVSQNDIVKECVAIFSRGAPQQACFSANKLLSCSLSLVEQECGKNASTFVVDYVTQFATVIDPRCKLASQIPIGRVVGISCSAEEDALIDNCAAPLNEIGQRMEEMFHGGLNQLVKNANMLAPIFAGACNLTEEFRMCAAAPLSGVSPCIVSNCMVKAGEEICAQPDPVKAIDDHLSCLFGQVQNPVFAKCVRSTLSTVKQFSLGSFRAILPKFTDCVEEIVKEKCGLTPIRVLRSISSPELCPLGGSPMSRQVILTAPPPVAPQRPIPNQGVQPVQLVPVNNGPARVEPVVCDPQRKLAYDACVLPFYTKYRMIPISLLNEVDNMDQVCADVAAIDACSQNLRMCSTPDQRGLKAIATQICATRPAFEQHKICLKTAVLKNPTCLSQFLSSTPEEACAAIEAAANCMLPEIASKCGRNAVEYTYPAMADYARYVDSKCIIMVPPRPVEPVMITTTPSTVEPSCSEDEFVDYLNCDMIIDQFKFTPVSIIGNASKWDEFCGSIATNYKPCLNKLTCKFEPVATANVQLFDAVCQQPLTLRDQKEHGECLSKLMTTGNGKRCVAPFRALDLTSKDSSQNMCKVLNSVLACASPMVEAECGFDALMHTFALHVDYAIAFDRQCIIASPQPTPTKASSTTTMAPTTTPEPAPIPQPVPEPEPEPQPSEDETPQTAIVAESTPEPEPSTTPTSTTTTTTAAATTTTTTTHPKNIRTQGGSLAHLSTGLLLLLVLVR